MDNWHAIARIVTGVLRRRKRIAVFSLLLALAGLLPPAYHLSKEQPRFTTAATIFVEMRPSRVPVFQELSPDRPLPVQLAILNSRSLAQSVLENLPPESLHDLAYSLGEPSPVDFLFDHARRLVRIGTGAERPPATDDLPLLNELRSRMTFTSTREGIVTITTVASKPEVAVQTANTFVEVLLARTRSFNQDDTRVSREFLERQLADVRASLNAAEQRLQRMAASHGGMKVPDRSRTVLADLSAAERSLAEVEANRKMVETRLAALRAKVASQKRPASTPRPAAPEPAPSPALEVQRLRDHLTRIETTLLDLRGRYTDEHPRVVLTREQLAQAQRELSLVVKENTVSTPEPSAVPLEERVDFAAQVVALETAFHTLTAQETALRNQGAHLRQSMTGLSQEELEYSRAIREVESNRGLFALLSDKLAAARIREQGEMQVVKVIDPAGRAVPARSARRMAFVFLAACGALVIGAGVPAAVEWTRRTVETEEDVAATTGLPVLSSVPRIRSRHPVFVRDVHESSRRLGGNLIFTEAFHSLRIALQFAMRSENIRTVLVTSPLAGEGKSTVVINLAHAFREAGQITVIADTDFHRPTLHRTLDTAPGDGFLDALDTRATGVEESLVQVDGDMWLLPRGSSMTPRTREALTTDRVKHILDRLSSRAKLVICDSAPVLPVPEALFLASAVDGVILVVKAGSTGRRELARAKARLEGAGARVIGVVLNELPLSTLRSYYDRYYALAPGNGGNSHAP